MAPLANITHLSRREKEILGLAGTGLTTRDIAARLSLSIDTVNTHRRNILRKTGAKNILLVVALAIQQKLIPVGMAA